jgi:crossover junction endodeoxyribonuclease RuvC
LNIAGIDVGLSGAICVMSDKDGHIVDLLDMPVVVTGKGKRELDEPAIWEVLADWHVDHVYIEKAQSMPGQGIASTGHYLTGYGILRGMCVGLQIGYTLVHPATWKKAMLLDQGKGKGESIVRAKQLWPTVKLDRKKDHGKADALLIAEYGRRMMT